MTAHTTNLVPFIWVSSDNKEAKLKFSKSDAVYLSRTWHQEKQKSHIVIIDEKVCMKCLKKLGGPCTSFCPGDVYSKADDAMKIKIDKISDLEWFVRKYCHPAEYIGQCVFSRKTDCQSDNSGGSDPGSDIDAPDKKNYID